VPPEWGSWLLAEDTLRGLEVSENSHEGRPEKGARSPNSEVVGRHRSKILATGSRENQKGKHAEAERPTQKSHSRIQCHDWSPDLESITHSKETVMERKKRMVLMHNSKLTRGKTSTEGKRSGPGCQLTRAQKHTMKVPQDPLAQTKWRPTVRQKKPNKQNVGMPTGGVRSKSVSEYRKGSTTNFPN
jgi:hypothetical protein